MVIFLIFIMYKRIDYIAFLSLGKQEKAGRKIKLPAFFGFIV